ncbi:MAG: gliding motility protein GldN [Flavobacteriales bacterium]|nr:gliding motility protein GldN [Flavobacteriales bacterium]
MGRLRWIIALSILLGTNCVEGQIGVKDGERFKPPVPYPPLRQADVMYRKVIWRTIDLREKFNHPLYYPLEPKAEYQSLFDVLLTGVGEGTITAYDPIDDEFNYPLSKTAVFSLLADTTIEIVDGLDGGYDTLEVIEEISAGDIRRYVIKEEWFFDKQRSTMDVRIVGIAPQAVKMDEFGNVIGRQTLFWIYFAEARPVFASQQVFNNHNDGARMSFDDLFWKRMFHSYIHKESNVMDRSIHEYKSGIAFQLEAERIKEKMRNFESDLWEY